MGDKPSYLGLLNAIALAESEAEDYLNVWAEVTPSDEVRSVLKTVAIREGEHGKAFAKRICELGFDVMPRPDESAQQERMLIASSTELSDCEKFEKLGVGRAPDGDDIFAGMFRDQTIDIQTGALLGRYIAEERDSNRMLQGCRTAVGATDAAPSTNGSSADLERLSSRLDRIEQLLEQSVKHKRRDNKSAKGKK